MGRLSSRLPKPKKALLFFAFQFLALSLLAQVRISGRVTGDGTTGVPNVSVQVVNTTFGTTTDDAGRYQLSANLKPGTYQLRFRVWVIVLPPKSLPWAMPLRTRPMRNWPKML